MKAILLVAGFLAISINLTGAISGELKNTVSVPSLKNDGVVVLINYLLSENENLKKEVKKLIPVGSIQAYMGKIAPDGWLICDGAPISENVKYDSLKALIGNNLPDLRDMFLRGKSDGRKVGDFQNDQFQTHTHYLESWASYVGHGKNNPHNAGYGGEGPYGESIPTKRFDSNSRHGSETRPKNIAVNYIIKF